MSESGRLRLWSHRRELGGGRGPGQRPTNHHPDAARNILVNSQSQQSAEQQGP